MFYFLEKRLVKISLLQLAQNSFKKEFHFSILELEVDLF